MKTLKTNYIESLNGQSKVSLLELGTVKGDLVFENMSNNPILSKYTISNNMTAVTEVRILNYDPTHNYSFDLLDSSLVSVERVDDVVKITSSLVTKDTSTVVKINATAPGQNPSFWVKMTINIKYFNATADGTISINDFSSDGESWDEVVFTEDGVKAISDVNHWISSPVSQEDEDEDWMVNKNSRLSIEPTFLDLGDDDILTPVVTTPAVLKWYSEKELSFPLSISLFSVNNDVNQIDINNLIAEKVSTVDNADLFNDGSLMAKFKFDSNTLNLVSGVTVNGTGLEYVDGKYDKGVFFNGVDGWMDLEDINLIRMDSVTYKTLSMWVKFDDITDCINFQYRYRTQAGYAGYTGIEINYNNITLSDGRVMTNIHNGTPYGEDVNLNLNQWYHVSISFANGNTCYIYIDGEMVGSGGYFKIDTKYPTQYTTKSINHSAVGYSLATGYQKGYLDQLEIYNRLLTNDEISTLYKREVNRYSVDITDLNLTEPPTKAWINKNIKVSTCTEETEERCLVLPDTRIGVL